MAGQTSNYPTSALIIDLCVALFPFETPDPIPFLFTSFYLFVFQSLMYVGFSPVNLCHVNLIRRPTKRTLKDGGNFFLPNTIKLF